MIVRMWEARVAPGRLAEATTWLRDRVIPRALALAACRGAEGFSASGNEERVVLLTRWDTEAAAHAFSEQAGDEDGTASSLVRAHAWTFRTID